MGLRAGSGAGSRAVSPTLRAGSRARSEKIGCAVNPAASGTGMMEYWNAGFSGMRSVFIKKVDKNGQFGNFFLF